MGKAKRRRTRGGKLPPPEGSTLSRATSSGDKLLSLPSEGHTRSRLRKPSSKRKTLIQRQSMYAPSSKELVDQTAARKLSNFNPGWSVPGRKPTELGKSHLALKPWGSPKSKRCKSLLVTSKGPARRSTRRRAAPGRGAKRTSCRPRFAGGDVQA